MSNTAAAVVAGKRTAVSFGCISSATLRIQELTAKMITVPLAHLKNDPALIPRLV
jgi:hypothetical protein